MQTNSRRTSLENVTFSKDVNAGLWLDKYFHSAKGNAADGQEEEAKQRHFSEITTINCPADYEFFYKRWKGKIEEINARSVEIVIDGRMIVGLGGASVLENSISIHRTYGVPYIPGSALKGLAAHFAHKHLGDEWRDDAKYGNANGTTGALHKLIFGSRDFAGFVVFYDALLCPETSNLPLHREIMTVHHQDYYQNGSAPPADWDSPVPIPFVSASGRYLLAVGAPDGLDHLADKAIEILAQALKTEGIGAKTSSGYGRASLKDTLTKNSEVECGPAVQEEKAEVDKFVYRVNALASKDVANQINGFYQEWISSKLSNESRKLMAEAIINKVRQAGREKVSQEKRWYQELFKFITGED